MNHETQQANGLPAGWVWTTIGEATGVILGQSPPSSTYNSDGIGLPFFQGKAEFGDLYPKVVKWCSEPSKIAEANDVLISVRAPVGPTNLCRERCCIGRGLAAIRTVGQMPSRYVLYYLRFIEDEWDSKATGTTFKAISGDTLRREPFPLAPLPEQHRIVAEIEAQFTRLDAGVAALKRVQAKLRRYKASVLKAACEGRLVPTEAELARAGVGAGSPRPFEPASALLARILAERRAQWERANPGKRYVEPKEVDGNGLTDLSEGWVWATVEQLTSHLTSGSRGWASLYAESGPLFIRAQNINTDELRLDDIAHVAVPESVEAQRTKVLNHDLLITITGANVTKTALVRNDIGEAYVSQHVGLVRPTMTDTSPYIYLWIVSPANGRRVLEKLAYGAGKPGLNLTNLRELAIALPPQQEQHRIVAEVERRLSVAQEVEGIVAAGLRRAERLRQSILKQAFEGRLVAQDPNDEPARMLLERLKANR